MFYNGVLGSLLKTGVIGLICTLMFVWFVSRMAIELVRLVQQRPLSDQSFFDRLCLLFCAQWFAFVVFFYLTNGDVNWWMQYFGLLAALIMAARRLQMQKEDEERLAVAQSEATTTKT
jgi:dipeptide/tripeptide permease